MSKASTMAGFVAGLVIGGAAAWYYAREMYSRIAEEEINSVKEAYARQKEQAEERPRTQAAVSPNKPDEKMDIRQYAQKVLKEGYTDYSHTVADKSRQADWRGDLCDFSGRVWRNRGVHQG